ncbi:MAG: histidinol-phosphate transaminase [Clostridiales Family XIII bacterium]|jgi:histidinol-phosphate aminotransferase|nr:histidinol-phosphate transaminase [Clostridiales Family XIII bacterium]
MAIRFRKELDGFTAYQQGKPAEAVQREFGLTRIEKLASNENQFGPSPLAIAAMKDELDSLNFYPESHPFELVGKLAEIHGLAPEQFAVGNGGEAVIWNLSMAALDTGDEIIMSSPSFDIYRISATYLGAKTVQIPLKGQRHDVEAMAAAVTGKTKIIWLCTPNNPTGHIASREQVDYLIDHVPDNVIIVLDEAYYDFAAARGNYPADSVSRLKSHDNIAVLRSFSKNFGMAGIRVGYMMTSPEIAAHINMVKMAFSVNRLAQAGAKAALGDAEYLQSIVEKNARALLALETYYDTKGWDYFPSYANFSWVNCRQDSRVLFDALQRKGVIVRPGHFWGWDTWIRVSTGTDEQMRFFIEKMDEVLAEL